ncbi:SRPBCC family protein [Williamsia herbipolensis]|uniref:SRPBCC family protein n=1 Tax=Williamsia herbipolensis TaxID=1603258 RepID=A0AAU4K1Y7_9NOCA|nr:DUF5995 family protein [Williamsia herbipolensis]
MTRIDMATDLDCSVEQAWKLLTDPAQKNTWSPVLTTVEDPGGDDRMDRPGAMREVNLGTPVWNTVHEVVTVADEPHRFDYVVYKSPAVLRNYHCRIDIDPKDDGCAVRYTVDVDFVSKFGALAEPGVRRGLERSLAGLSAQSKLLPATSDRGRPASRRRPRRSTAMLLRPEAGRQLEHQRHLAAELAAEGDPKYWFARMVELTTEELLRLVDAEVFAEPEWVLRLLAAIHRRHVSVLHSYRTDGPVPPRWRAAWGACDEIGDGRRFRHMAGGVVSAAQAHMNEDMHRALAEVYDVHYRDTRHYKEFRPDYLRMAPMYGAALDRLIADMPAPLMPRLFRLSRIVAPELRDSLLRRCYYDVERDRMLAFERGYHLTRDGVGRR